MIEKNMGFSLEQLVGFLEKMDGTTRLEDYLWRFKSAKIQLVRLEKSKDSYFNIERCLMRLWGDNNDIEEFYYLFLINHMTMGG